MSVGLAGTIGWVLSLLALAGIAAGAGEGVRWALARSLPWFRGEETVERVLMDLYLGGATFYVLAVLPLGLFRATVVVGATTLAIAVGAVALLVRDGTSSATPRPSEGWRRGLRPAVVVAGIAAFALLVLEVVAANGVATGNTFDSSVDATFTALLTAHGNVALTLQPVSNDLIAYPQGSTAWFGAAQLLVGWPAVTAPLMLTPLFMALAPLGGYVVGRRWFHSDRAAGLFAIGMAVVVPGTRYVAYGSNDFVLAFPLVLLLAARSAEWLGGIAPSRREALAFGLLTGVSAALNPVGAEWLLTTLGILCLVRIVHTAAGRRGWAEAWSLAATVGAVAVLPSLLALALGAASGSAGPAVGPGGISGAQVIGWADPFLFGGRHPGLSPDLALQIELAILLAAGAVVLVWQAASRSGTHRSFRAWIAAAVVAGLAWELLAVIGGSGAGWASALSAATSAGEMALLLATLYCWVALYPMLLALELTEGPTPASLATSGARRRGPTAVGPTAPMLAVAAVVLLLLPGVVATAAWLPAENQSVYGDFSRVTPAELALVSYTAGRLTGGDRVLVAPGSAAEFLPAYNPTLTVLFPMTGASWRDNPVYVQLCGLLVNGTFGAASGNAGLSDLAALDVHFILVTGNDTTLFPSFDDAAMRASGDFSILYGSSAGTLFAYSAPVAYAAAA